MKKTICILITINAVIFQFSGLFAQSSIGLRGGFNLSTIKNFPGEQDLGELTDEVMFGNYNALSFEVGITPMFAIQPEFNYIQKGGKVGLEETGETFLRVKIDYIEAPLLAKVRFGQHRFKGYLIAGPSVGYAIVGKSKLTLGGISIEDDIEFDDEYGIDGRKDNRFDISAVAGGGVQYKLGPGSIVLDARLGYDLNDFNRFKDDKPDGHKSTRYESVMVSLGYQIDL